MPVFMPWPPAGLWMWAASPAKQHAALAVVGDFALVDAEVGEPDRIGDGDALRAALVELGLDVGERGVGRMDVVGRGAGVGDHAEAVVAHREDHEHALVVPVGADFVFGDGAVHVDVGEHPVVGLGGAGEVHAEGVADGAVGAVAADEPGDVEGFFAAVGVAEFAGDGVGTLGE